MKPLLAADLFCGAGGTSTGLLRAAAGLGRAVDLLAINHWPTAIDSHSLNHPGVRHLCASLETLDPAQVTGGRLDLLCASPECTHHSKARGGKPRSDQSRASAWHICHWAQQIYIENILIENVREFEEWGPLGKRGKPLKKYKGRTFKTFIAALRAMGYAVEHRVLNAADYGDPTTRQRLFIIARRGNKVTWPLPTHAGKWRAAREIIDWSLKGKSIFDRKRPLSPNTLRRIEAGLRKFGGESFLVKFHGNHSGQLDGTRRVHSCDNPIPTLDTSNRMGLAQPFIIQTTHTGANRLHDMEEPLPTITCAHRGEMALIEPFLVNLRGTGDAHTTASAKSLDNPCATVTAGGNHIGLVDPFLVKYNSNGGARAVAEPVETISTRDRFGLVQPFIIGQQSCAAPRSTEGPLPTIATDGAIALVEPHISNHRLEILFRMLQPHELSAAMGFPAEYKFTGNRGEQVKQIGNAVAVGTAQALCAELIK